jgi:hypothetical protein
MGLALLNAFCFAMSLVMACARLKEAIAGRLREAARQ